MEKPFDLLPLLTPGRAAKLLNLPVQTVLDMIDRNELRAVRLGGRRLRLSRSEVNKLLSHPF